MDTLIDLRPSKAQLETLRSSIEGISIFEARKIALRSNLTDAIRTANSLDRLNLVLLAAIEARAL